MGENVCAAGELRTVSMAMASEKLLLLSGVPQIQILTVAKDFLTLRRS
jgi:hypothetical protein